MITQLEELKKKSKEKISSLKNLEDLIECKNEILWKKGALTSILKWVKDLDVEQKKTVGKLSNEIKKDLENHIELQKEVIKKQKIQDKIQNDFYDLSLPISEDKSGKVHPIYACSRELMNIFSSMGFSVFSSNEISSEYENFDALNLPSHHPARDMQDTFWIKNIGKTVLSTQTSSIQNHLLKNEELPIRAITFGHVFRNEELDATHEIMFDQLEGILVGKNINLGHLRYTIKTMFTKFFKKDILIRMRPGYFPFVEPGVEVDISCPFCEEWKKCRVCKWSKWIETGWAGLMHPNILREWGIDPEEYSGFAFGFWLTRLVMIRHGISDVRYFNSGRLDFLNQF